MSDPVEVSTDAVRRLIAPQFPARAGVAVVPVPATGTDNAMFRLGPRLAVRLPRVERAVASLEKELAWLPRLAPHLALPVPVPVARGEPGEGYPWPWSVCRWIAGGHVVRGAIPDEGAFARQLAGFVRGLWALDPSGGPTPGRHNFGRGGSLSRRDAATRAGIADLRGFDAGALGAMWDEAVQAADWHEPPVWIHGDLQGTNLLARGGRLAGVIDFGGLGLGDPACDLIVAWSLFGAAGRAAFRSALPLDDAAWVRGRGWALSTSVIALNSYRERLPSVAATAEQTIRALLCEAG